MQYYFPLVLDGATGTQLQKRGYDGSICAEEWTLLHPEAITEIQKAYKEAGSDIVYAPTFGANRIKLEENHIYGKVEEYNRRLVQISRDAVGDDVLVAGDLTSVGKFILPYGNMHFEELADVYREQALALEKAGVDLFVVETLITVPEARAAVMAIREVSDKPILVSFTADLNNKTVTGSDITAVLEIMQSMGIAAFGLNCSVGPDSMVDQIRELSTIAQIPLMAKANAGMPVMVDGKAVYDCPTELYTDHIAEFAEMGVGMFGACCGSTEEHIKAIAEAVKNVEVKKPLARTDGKLYLCTEKKLFILESSAMPGKPLPCSASLADDIEECEDEILAVSITSQQDFEYFEEAQYAVDRPLCLMCEDAELLEKALRVFQGKCMYEGSLDPEVLASLSEKYGLVY